MIRTSFLLLCACAAIVAAGCGSSDPERLDAGKAEGSISAGIKRQLDLDLRVSCPRDVELKKGKKFTCTAKGSDTEKLPIPARQKDAKGNVTWRADIMGTEQVEKSVASEARSKRKIVVALDCPEAVELKPESTFTCAAETPDGQKDTVTVTVEDEKGNVTWAFPDAPPASS